MTKEINDLLYQAFLIRKGILDLTACLFFNEIH